MKILTVLQNAYSYEPLKREISKEVWFRLMCRCTTGKRLSKIFTSMSEMQRQYKNGLLRVIDSTEIWGVGVSSRLKADSVYLAAQLNDFKPDLVITCGMVAENALKDIWNGNLICIPHPASRTLTNNLLYSTADYIAKLDMNVLTRVAFRQNKGFFEIQSL